MHPGNVSRRSRQKALMRVAPRQLDARKPSVFELSKQLFPALFAFSKGDLQPEDLPIALLTDADDNQCRQSVPTISAVVDRTALWCRTLSTIASATRNGYSSSRGRSALAELAHPDAR
jgi:hypothetical protein